MRIGGVKGLLATAVAALAVGAAAPNVYGVRCSMPGAWPRTADAAWLVRALHRAGFGSYGCTGSALTVELRRGPELYVWTTRGCCLGYRRQHSVRVDGVLVRRDRLRAFWRAGSRIVWVEMASPGVLPPVARWRRIVRATSVSR
jgi:hypothetical protein